MLKFEIEWIPIYTLLYVESQVQVYFKGLAKARVAFVIISNYAQTKITGAT